MVTAVFCMAKKILTTAGDQILRNADSNKLLFGAFLFKLSLH